MPVAAVVAVVMAAAVVAPVAPVPVSCRGRARLRPRRSGPRSGRTPDHRVRVIPQRLTHPLCRRFGSGRRPTATQNCRQNHRRYRPRRSHGSPSLAGRLSPKYPPYFRLQQDAFSVPDVAKRPQAGWQRERETSSPRDGFAVAAGICRHFDDTRRRFEAPHPSSLRSELNRDSFSRSARSPHGVDDRPPRDSRLQMWRCRDSAASGWPRRRGSGTSR